MVLIIQKDKYYINKCNKCTSGAYQLYNNREAILPFKLPRLSLKANEVTFALLTTSDKRDVTCC